MCLFAGLQQATELSAHFARVKSVFAEGDLQRIAATLASIRQGLALVGNVPEFRGGSAKLAVRCTYSLNGLVLCMPSSSFKPSLCIPGQKERPAN